MDAAVVVDDVFDYVRQTQRHNLLRVALLASASLFWHSIGFKCAALMHRAWRLWIQLW